MSDNHFTPVVHVFSIMWNEEYLLPYFLRHYSTFADTIFIFNDHSTDRTAEIAKAHPKVRLLDFNYDPGLHEDNFNDCFIKSYKQYSRGVADWVMCVDADELIYNRDIVGVLSEQHRRGIKALKCTGYIMVSEKLPTTKGQIYDECKIGTRSRGYDKPIVFSPEIDIKFGIGRHTAQLPPGIQAHKAKLTLLHYRYLSRDYIIERNAKSFPRWFGMDDKQKQYRTNGALKWYDNAIKTGQDLVEVV